MPTELRESQVKLLRAVRDSSGYLRDIAQRRGGLRLGRLHRTRRALFALRSQGLVGRSNLRPYGPHWGLSGKGKAALLDREGSR